MSEAAPRWSPCVWCGADSLTLFSALRCTGQACRWYCEATYQQWLAERPGAYSWVWGGPEGTGAGN